MHISVARWRLVQGLSLTKILFSNNKRNIILACLNMDSAKETYLSFQNNSNLTLSQLLLLQISSQKHILKLHQYYLLIGSGSAR